MSRIFDPYIPEDLDLLHKLVAMNPDIRLEYRSSEKNWMPWGKNWYTLGGEVKIFSFIFGSEDRVYRVEEPENEQDI